MAEDIKSDLGFDKRKEDFFKDYKLISSKYKIDIAPMLNYSKYSVEPRLVLIDLEKEKKNG